MKRAWIALALTAAICLGGLASCKGTGGQTNTPPVTTESPLTPQPEIPKDTTNYQAVMEAPFAELTETPAEDFTTEELENGEIRITGYTGEATRVRVPSMIDGRAVTSLGNGVFQDHTKLAVLFIPDSVTDFGSEILKGCGAIYALRTPLCEEEGKTYLGYLYGATSPELQNTADLRNLAYLMIGGNATSLADRALYDCNDLVCVGLPSTMTSLGEYALYRCESLKYVNVEKITTLSPHALSYCRSLPSLTFGQDLQAVGFAALEGCEGLREITLPYLGESREKNTYLGYLFGATDPALSRGFYPLALREITLLEGCESIAAHGLYDCETVEQLHLPTTLTKIETRALSGCLHLQQIQGLESVAEIGENAFANCLSLKEIALGGLRSLGINAFLNCDALTAVTLQSDQLEAIPTSCFADCDALKSLTLSGVRRVDAYAFFGCDALETVSLGDITEVGENAFGQCPSIATVTATGRVDFGKGNDAVKALL